MTELVLHEAAANGDYHELESLVLMGKIDINFQDEEFGDRTALHWAAYKGEMRTRALFAFLFTNKWIYIHIVKDILIVIEKWLIENYMSHYSNLTPFDIGHGRNILSINILPPK